MNRENGKSNPRGCGAPGRSPRNRRRRWSRVTGIGQGSLYMNGSVPGPGNGRERGAGGGVPVRASHGATREGRCMQPTPKSVTSWPRMVSEIIRTREGRKTSGSFAEDLCIAGRAAVSLRCPSGVVKKGGGRRGSDGPRVPRPTRSGAHGRRVRGLTRWEETKGFRGKWGPCPTAAAGASGGLGPGGVGRPVSGCGPPRRGCFRVATSRGRVRAPGGTRGEGGAMVGHGRGTGSGPRRFYPKRITRACPPTPGPCAVGGGAVREYSEPRRQDRKMDGKCTICLEG